MTDREQAAIKKMYAADEQRDKAAVKRAQAVAVAELKGRLAAQGKTATRAEVAAAETEAWKQWNLKRSWAGKKPL